MVVLAAGLVGVGVFVALAGVPRRPRVALVGLTMLAPLGLALGIGWSGFTDKVLNDPNAEAVGPHTTQLETVVYSCSPPFGHQPLYLGWGFKGPVCTDDARLRRRIVTCLLIGGAVSSLALVLSRSLGRRAAPVTPGAP